MKKLLKVFLSITTFCFIATILTACGKSSPASLGIESPSESGFMPIGFYGLSVYGTGKINAANKTAQIEIKSSTLSKIKTGDSVVLLNRTINRFDGTISTIPDAKAVDNDTTCTIEATLDYNGDDLSNSENIEMKATINLPAKDGVWVVDKRCIEHGNNDKQYVWATKKNPEELVIGEEGWELVEVKTGETDGEDIEVTEGLKGFHTVYVGRKQ